MSILSDLRLNQYPYLQKLSPTGVPHPADRPHHTNNHAYGIIPHQSVAPCLLGHWAVNRTPNVSESATNLANHFANALSGTRHDKMRRQLGNTRHMIRASERKRS